MAFASRIPPLVALRAFEAAARLGSFTAAAAEICVTNSAVSHQIRALEDAIGRRLFLRRGPRVRLTAEGAFLAERVRESLEELARAVRAVSASRDDPARAAAPRTGGGRAVGAVTRNCGAFRSLRGPRAPGKSSAPASWAFLPRNAPGGALFR